MLPLLTNDLYRIDVHQANILFDQGNVAEAEAMWQHAFDIFNRLNEVHPATISAHMKLACLKMKKKPEDLSDAMYVLLSQETVRTDTTSELSSRN